MGDVRISFPLKGKDENWAASGQPPLTSPDLQNVRPRDIQDKRSRGGQRPGVRKIMYWWDYPGSGADLGLPYPSPIVGLAQVTAVYYASIAGEVDCYIDPAGGDPKWDGIVLILANDINHEIQLYSFTGNSIEEIDLDIGDIGLSGIALDQLEYIYIASGAKDMILKYTRTGELLDSVDIAGADSFCVSPTNKNDGVIFVYAGGLLRALSSDDLSTEFWNKYLGAEDPHYIIQLNNSDDLLLPMYDFHPAEAVRRVSRLDGSTIRSYVGDGSAKTIAVDEANNWLYKGGGVRPTKDRIYRFNLATGDYDTHIQIPGGDIKKVIFHGGKIYAAGVRATDNNTIWKIDAALTAIEADYDTGATVNDMRITLGGILYAVGISGTNEDTDTGNVNVLTDALVYVESWAVRTTETILRIADKVRGKS